MVKDRRGWTTHYYDAVEYYFWGPDKLNARWDPRLKPGLDPVMNRLKRLEEPLNHCLTLFLDLAPISLLNDLAGRAAGIRLGAGVEVGDRSIHGVFDGRNVVQPDVLITGSEGVLAVEVKLGSRSGAEQVLKYALLLSRVAGSRPYALTYLTEKPFPWHWRDCASPADVKSAALARLSELERLGELPLDQTVRAEISAAVESLELRGWSFPALAACLDDWTSQCGEGPGDQTLRGLCAGMADELRVRGLA